MVAVPDFDSKRSARKPLLMIQAELFAESLPILFESRGEASDLILAGLGLGDHPVETVAVCRDEPLPPAERYAGVVVTGSVAMVADAKPWIGRTAAFLREAAAADVPTLGICFGHQLLAHALGGRVDWLASGPEYASVEVARAEAAAGDAIFGDLPERFGAQGCHYQAVMAPPPGASVLATSESGLQAMRVGRSWGVQFHPEFDAPVMRLILDLIAPKLTASGVDVAANIAGVVETPVAASVLGRFGAVVRGA